MLKVEFLDESGLFMQNFKTLEPLKIEKRLLYRFLFKKIKTVIRKHTIAFFADISTLRRR